MGVGNADLCSHRLSRILWSENGPLCGTIACFVGGIRGVDLVKYNLFQTLSICKNNLAMFVCRVIYLEPNITFVLQFVLKFIIMKKKKKMKKNHGLPELSWDPPLGGGLDKNFGGPWNLIHSPPCKTPCKLFILEIFFGPLGLHLFVWTRAVYALLTNESS